MLIDVLPLRTPTVPPATHTNCYRVGRTLFDPASPWPDEQERLAAWAGTDVERVVLTHHHPDHIGGVVDIVRRTGAEVWAHHDARLPFHVEHRLSDGDTFDTSNDTSSDALTCLHTPGHADGHLCFRSAASGEILAGDMVAGVGTIVLVPPEGNLAVYLASLERLLPIATVLHPAHGPAIPDGPALIRRYIAHRHMRTAQFAEVLRSRGPASPVEIAERVYAGIPGVDFTLAALQVRAHLAWLGERGEARAVADDLWEGSA